ncbi:dihydropteroate synthase [Candidatus Poribacteria bacterium]|nr:dihydropteroate synthase [Candidatus Poribacteria bacterium]
MNTSRLITIGARINSSRKTIARAIEERNGNLIQQEARMQRDAGVSYIDVNAGAFVGREVEYLPWLVKVVQAAVDTPLWIDSADPESVEAALRIHRGTAVINSVTFESSRLNGLLPLAVKYSCGVVALTIDSIQIPEQAEKKLDIAIQLVDTLTTAGIEREKIFIDPVVLPVSVSPNAGKETLRAITMIRERLAGIHIVAGVGNVSFQLPQRSLLEATYLVMAMVAGIDCAFIDPCNSAITTPLTAAEALLGMDEYCIRFINAHREGRLWKK